MRQERGLSRFFKKSPNFSGQLLVFVTVTYEELQICFKSKLYSANVKTLTILIHDKVTFPRKLSDGSEKGGSILPSPLSTTGLWHQESAGTMEGLRLL